MTDAPPAPEPATLAPGTAAEAPPTADPASPAPAPVPGRLARLGGRLAARLASLLPDATSALVLVVVGSMLLRGLWLGAPDGALVFDEAYYVNAARVIAGVQPPEGAAYRDAALGLDPNREHPPLGKVLIAAGIATLGDNALAWRLPSLAAALLGLLAVAGIVRRLGGSAWLAVLATAIYGLDVLSFLHGRVGTLDGPATGLVLAAAWAALDPRRVRGAALAGVLLALALLVKLPSLYAAVAIGLFALGPALRALVAQRRLPLRELRAPVVLGVVTAAVATGGLWVLDRAVTEFPTPWAHLEHMLRYGFALADRYKPDSISSLPWDWALNKGEISYLRVNVNLLVDGEIVGSRPTVWFRAALNPVLAGGLALVLPHAAWLAWRRRDRIAGWSLLWLAAGFLPFVALALTTNRVMYLYYVLPVVPALAIATALVLARLRVPRSVVAGYLAATALAFLAYFPFRQLPGS